MKKIFLFAALAGIVFASCQKEASVAAVQNEGQQEITFSALSKAMTKGVLGTGTSFGDATTSVRTINVAGVTKTADGSVVDFLEAKTFRYITDGWKGAKYDGSSWVADHVYYPIGGGNEDYHFLAYSESSDVESVARWYGSSEVEIQVGEESAQNDIVYSDFIGNKSGAADATFKHTQALVTVQIMTKEETSPTIRINKIGFKDVKTSGTLNIKLDKSKVGTAASPSAPYASHKWIYNAGCNCACAEMGNYWLSTCYNSSADDADKFKVTENIESTFTSYTGTSAPNDGYGEINNVGCIFDRFFPAQKVEAATMIVNYTLGSMTAEVELALDGSGTPAHASAKIWEASKRYVYRIIVDPAEITINPKADAWIIDTINAGEYN